MFNISYQNGGRSIIERILLFHDWLIIFVLSISLITVVSIWIIKESKLLNRNLLDSQVVEITWTIGPILILAAIGLPSLKLLYLFDSIESTRLTVKVLGRQWYWQYDYPDVPSYDSYLVGRLYRNLDVDHRLVAPSNTNVQLLITAADVLHSWTIPTMAVKADAVPGRVNKLNLNPKRPGVYYGQCREICGRNHRFIPISIESYKFNQSFTLKVKRNTVKYEHSHSFQASDFCDNKSCFLYITRT